MNDIEGVEPSQGAAACDKETVRERVSREFQAEVGESATPLPVACDKLGLPDELAGVAKTNHRARISARVGFIATSLTLHAMTCFPLFPTPLHIFLGISSGVAGVSMAVLVATSQRAAAIEQRMGERAAQESAKMEALPALAGKPVTVWHVP